MTVSAFLKLVTSIKEKELRNMNNKTFISLNYFNRFIPFNGNSIDKIFNDVIDILENDMPKHQNLLRSI